MLRDLRLRAIAGLGIALKDFLVLSKLQEIAPGAKFNLACPYFSSEEVTCRIARVTDTKVDLSLQDLRQRRLTHRQDSSRSKRTRGLAQLSLFFCA